MYDFEEYLRQGEPNKVDKATIWRTAIGLQKVDGLEPSDYLISTARQNIEGDITIQEVKERIENYYVRQPKEKDDNRTEEADKVSARIMEILSENTFTFSPAEYLTIHRRLFQDIYSHAGKIRNFNITKQEWLLEGDTVLYASADSLKDTLEYDFEQEKKFNYRGLSKQEIIQHIAHFISYLWQIHIFGEGNTRTTAIFLIKYLRKLGFKDVNNDLFAEHSWYFRNALVRANYENLSKGIYKTEKFLIRFLQNLIHNENHILRNREMHVQYFDPVNVRNTPVNYPKASAKDPVNSKFDPVNIPNDLVNNPVNTPIDPVKGQYDTINTQIDPVREQNDLEKNPNNLDKDPVNNLIDSVKGQNEPVKNPDDLVNKHGIDPANNPVKRSILQHLKQNPKANYRELADKTRYSTATIKRHIQELKKLRIIERIGSDKTGNWKIIKQ